MKHVPAKFSLVSINFIVVDIETKQAIRLPTIGQGGVYNKLGSVAVTDISLFVDLTSEPEKTQ